jgi:PAS domain S-box-containing protein
MSLASLCTDPIDEASPTAMVLIGKDKGIVHLNGAAERLLRHSRRDFLGKPAESLFPSLSRAIQETFASGSKSFGHEVVLDCGKFYVDLLSVELSQGVGGLLAIVNHKQWGKLEALDLFKTYFPAILDSFRDGIWICDAQARVLLINLASARINGVKAKEVLGKNMVQLVEEGLVDRSVTQIVLEEQVIKTLIQHTRAGKQILVTGYPVFNNRGEIVLVVITERDLTELTKLRMELEKSRSLAREYRTEISQLLIEQSELTEVVARSRAMQRSLQTALKVASAESNVVLEGESGVGKSMFASLIHRNSMSKDGPFIQVDCGAIPETLIESELFGYEPGAFTGARAKGKAGLFELANGGTLFLDEVGELPLAMQVKLLRFVESNELVRLGGVKPRRIQVRIIAATNRNLSQMVKTGHFREDLFFRLNVVPLRIPPLRERLEDIPPLCVHILERFNKRKKSKKRLSPEVLDRLMMHNFPGNVRELINLMERMIVMSEGEVITLADLPRQLRSAPLGEIGEGVDWSDGEYTLKAALEAFESHLILGALHRNDSMAAAARTLGTKPSTLWRKVKRLGIKPFNDKMQYK